MKILLTGVTGQLGRALVRSVPRGVDLVSVDRATADLADAAAIERLVRAEQPAVVINAAAYTAVDKAESERELAFAVNAAAPGAMARACVAARARLIHISTDFVFDGRKSTPYDPADVTQPVNVYGESKLAGEQQIAAASGSSWLIIRTAWVYGGDGRNFLLTMLRLFRERSVVNVVCDQIGSPTSAASLARCVWRAVSDNGPSAVLHYTDSGVASWYDFAVAIYEEARSLGLITNTVSIVPIGTDQYPTPARRPHYSVLDKRASLARLQMTPPHWRASLRDVLQEMVA